MSTEEPQRTLGLVLSECFYTPFLAGASIEDIAEPLREAVAILNVQFISLEPLGVDGIRLVIIDPAGDKHEAAVTWNSPTNEAVT